MALNRTILLTALILLGAASIGTARNADSVPPLVERTLGGPCSDTVSAVVTDMPDDAVMRSNLASVDLIADQSYNCRIDVEPFEEGVARGTTYRLSVIDSRYAARGVVRVYDKAGNVTIDTADFAEATIAASPRLMVFGSLIVGMSSTRTISLENRGEPPMRVLEVGFGRGNVGFTVADTTIPFRLEGASRPGSVRSVAIRFDATKTGRFTDSLWIRYECGIRYVAALTAQVGAPIIEVTDHDFGSWPTSAQAVDGLIEIRNISTDGALLTVTGVAKPISDEVTFTLPDGLPAFPLALAAGASRTLRVAFKPSAARPYLDSIVFAHNAPPNRANDAIGVLRGRGRASLTATGYDWDRKAIGGGPYDAVITLTNDGIAPLTLRTPLVREFDIADFQVVDESALSNRLLAPNESIDVPVRFTPTVTGVRVMRITFPHDPAEITPATSTLRGTGIDPSAAAPEDPALALTTLGPNPARGDEARLTFSSVGPATIRLTTLTGETLRTLETPAGATEAWLDLRGLATGSYLVSLNSGGRIDVRRLVVEH